MLHERGEAAFITRSLLTSRAMMGTNDVSKSRRKQPDSPRVKLKKSWSMLLMFTLTLVVISKAEDTSSTVTSRLATTQHEVVNVVVPVTPDRFLKAFILDERFTHNFFQLSKDKDVRLGSWARISSSAGGRGRAVTAMTRDIEYSHPVKTRFPGMPSHAKTYKKQEYAYDSRKGVLELEEHLRFEGIPKADHFTVDTAWKVRSLDGRRAGGKSSSQVTISLRVNFLKKTILRKTIESQTLAEQGESLRNWMATAQGTLADQGSTGIGIVGGANGFQAAGSGGGAPLPSCPSAGIRSFLSRNFGGLWQKLRSLEDDDQPAAIAR